MSPIDYLIKKRLEIARYFLLNTSYPVAEIAKQIGYDNPLYFSSLFKKNMGVSPTEYRKTYRQRLHEEVHVPLILKETKGED